MKERINLLICSDINYSCYYGVMLTSLFYNNKDSIFDVYLLTDSSWTTIETEKFQCLCRKYESRFIVNVVDENIVKDFPKVAHITLPTYYRLLAFNFLPNSLHKLLYLDGDMIVNGSLRSLWDTDIRDYACAMVPNCTYFDSSYYERLQYDAKYGYYNNGAILYNLDYLRKYHFEEKALEYIREHSDRILYMDQDVQNALLHDKILSLPFKYNLQTLFYSPIRWNTYTDEFRKNVMMAADNPIIIHYLGTYKPWQFQYYLMPYGSIWTKYRRVSMWRHCVIRKPRKEFIKHLCKRIFKRSALIALRNKEYMPNSLRFT